MGECGCGSDIEEYQFPGPDGSVYTIGRWVGCEQCHGTAIVLDRVEPDDQRWISLVPPAPVAWHGGHVLPLIDVDRLRRLLVERCTFGPDDDEYATLDDALYDHLRDCVEAAMFGYGEKSPQSDSKPEADQGAPGDGPEPETASEGCCGPGKAVSRVAGVDVDELDWCDDCGKVLTGDRWLVGLDSQLCDACYAIWEGETNG